MNITRVEEGGTVALRVIGKLDTFTSPALETALTESFRDGCDVVLDLSGVDYVSSAGLGVFLVAEKTSKRVGCRFSLRAPSPRVRDLLTMTGLASIFAIVP